MVEQCRNDPLVGILLDEVAASGTRVTAAWGNVPSHSSSRTAGVKAASFMPESGRVAPETVRQERNWWTP
jgi:hypothetical protein